jgi:hypothetical protein
VGVSLPEKEATANPWPKSTPRVQDRERGANSGGPATCPARATTVTNSPAMTQGKGPLLHFL